MAMIFDGPWVASLIEDASEDIKDDLLATRIPFENVPGSMSNSLHIPASISDEEKDILTDAAKIFVIKGEPVQLVRGEKSNVKITYPYDLTVAESLLKGE